MNLKNVLTLAFGVALLGSTSTLRAADAVLVQKSGTGAVTAILPDGSTKDLSQGDAIPEGSTVKTSADAVANIMPAAGEIATLQANTTVKLETIRISRDGSGTVTKQEVLLDLTSGDLVATLDPSKRAIDDFKVHTAIGTVAARGTAFSVSVKETTGVSVTATADSVVISVPGGGSYTVAAGQISYTPPGSKIPGTPIPLANAATNPVIAAIINQAVTVVSSVVENNLAHLSSSDAMNLLTQVVGVASAAEPSMADAFAEQAARAVTATTSVTAANGTQAAAAVAAAAAAGAPTKAREIAAVVTAVATTASGVTSKSLAGTTIAGAVTAAAASASGTSVADIAAYVSIATGANDANSIASAAASSNSSNAQNSTLPSTATVTQQVIQITTPANRPVASPSS